MKNQDISSLQAELLQAKQRINELERLTTSLREKQETYKLLFDKTDNAFAYHEMIYDNLGMPVDYRFLDINEAFEKLTGLKKEVVLGKRVLEVLPQTEAYWIENYGKVATTGESLQFENFSQELNKHYHVIVYSPKKGYFAVTFTDITLQKETEQKIRESEEKFLKAFYSSPAFMVISTVSEGRFVDINTAFTDAFGYSREEIIGKTSTEINLWKNPVDRQLILAEVEGKKNTRNLEIQFLTKTRETIWILLTAEIIYLEQEPHLITIGIDITERKKVAQKLEKALVKAQEADKLKSAFLAVMSHEIRTPLNVILGYSALISDENSAAKIAEYAQIIQQSGKNLLGIISDILDLSVIESGQLVLNQRPVSLLSLFKTIKAKIMVLLSGDIIFKYSLPPELNKVVLVDELRLQQVLDNLISNAIKFTDKGIIECGVSLENDQTMQFYVKDTGIGMVPEVLETIFDSFTQADMSHTRKYGGVGLGLAIVKKLVLLMGGSIRVNSKLKSGTVFYFTIPYLAVNSPQKEEIAVAVDSGILTVKKILLVDDHLDSQKLVKAMLKDKNYDIITAGNGREAFKTYKLNQDINLILMDIQMPLLDGIEVVKMIRKEEKEKSLSSLPIIALTASAMKGDKERCIEAGYSDYIAKPIDKKTLIEKLIIYLS